MTREELKEEVSHTVDSLKVEHYDVMHEHGYADFKLDDYKEDPAYDKAEQHLSELYDEAFMKLIDEYVAQEVAKAKE